MVPCQQPSVEPLPTVSIAHDSGTPLIDDSGTTTDLKSEGQGASADRKKICNQDHSFLSDETTTCQRDSVDSGRITASGARSHIGQTRVALPIRGHELHGVGGTNKEKLPSPSFLTSKSGTKEGQVQMIKEANGFVTADTWSMSQQQWVNIGTVAGAVGSTGNKVEYHGKKYDFVFDVDIEDGKPPLKLPYNLLESPYERAAKFLVDNELPLSYLDNVANFITENTKSATWGEQSGLSVPDPYSTEKRYLPGDETAQPKVLPQKEFMSTTAANYEAMFGGDVCDGAVFRFRKGLDGSSQPFPTPQEVREQSGYESHEDEECAVSHSSPTEYSEGIRGKGKVFNQGALQFYIGEIRREVSEIQRTVDRTEHQLQLLVDKLAVSRLPPKREADVDDIRPSKKQRNL